MAQESVRPAKISQAPATEDPEEPRPKVNNPKKPSYVYVIPEVNSDYTLPSY